MQSLLRKSNQLGRLTERRLEILPTYVEEAVLSLVLETQQSVERLGSSPSSWRDLLDEGDRRAMILPSRSSPQGLAARSIGRRNPREHSKRGCWTGEVDLVSFAGNQFCDFEELLGVAETCCRVGI